MAELYDLYGALGNTDVAATLAKHAQDIQVAAFGRQQLQHQLNQQHAADVAQQAAMKDPSAANINRWAIAAPDQWQAIHSAHNDLTADEQRQNLQDLSAVYGYLGAGNHEAARGIIQRRIDADKAAGHDTADDAAMLAQIDSDPTHARAIAGLQLAGSIGPDKFSEAYGKLGEEDRANAAAPSIIAKNVADAASANATTAKTQAETERLKNPLPETDSVTDPTTGAVIFYDKHAPPPAGVGGTGVSTLPPALSAFVDKLTVGSENTTRNPAAANPRSSAVGNGQFLKQTWLDLIKANRPDLAQGKTDDQVLALRSNPQIAHDMTGLYAMQNANALQAQNLPVNATTLAMAHKLGPGGAQAVLSADPNAKLATILPAPVLAANPQLRNQTAGSYARGLMTQFGTGAVDTQPGDPTASGEDFLKTLPSGRADYIKGLASGRVAFPAGFSASRPAGQLLLQQVAQYDPNFDAVNFRARQQTRTDFTSGKSAQNITALNTAIGHLGSLDHAIDGLGNYGLPINNAAAHWIAGVTGTDERVKKFETIKKAAMSEVSKVFIGSAGALADREEWLKQLNASSNPQALHGVVGQITELLGSRIDALGEQYNRGMGTTKDPLDLLNPHAKETFQRLQQGSTQAQAEPPRVAVNPATGQKIVFDPASGQWKPA